MSGLAGAVLRARRLAALLVVLGSGLFIALPAAANAPFIVVASTTSTEQSGLFARIVPIFTAATGIEVRVVAVGTGQAFAIARAGDADVLFAHDTAGEELLVAEGFGLERRDVMFNDFIILGPSEDPAGIAIARTAVEALQRIARVEAPFASRGDDSGTHRAEQRLWTAAGIESVGRWYRSLGSGMGPTLNTAAGMDAYVLADRGTWANFRNRQNLVVLFEGDPALFNPYASVLLNPQRHPHIRQELALQWHHWLLSEAGQAAIAGFAINGEPVFFPLAD
ncbi:MAG: substrate-binding domain-containing protein [Wenzhouxiangella sp.]